MSKFLIILILILMNSTILNAKVFEVKSLREVSKFVESTKNAVIVFDLDNTLIAPVQTLGSDQWFSYLLKIYNDSGLNEKEAKEKSLQTWVPVQKATKVRTVEQKTAAFVRYLQMNKRTVFGLTARPATLAKTTIKQLLSVRIDLRKNAPQFNDSAFLKDGSMYMGGIIFQSPTLSKGQVLANFLKTKNLENKPVIFVDDRSFNIQAVETELSNQQIPIAALRYGFEDYNVSNFNESIATQEHKQFLQCGILINDQMAKSGINFCNVNSEIAANTANPEQYARDYSYNYAQGSSEGGPFGIHSCDLKILNFGVSAICYGTYTTLMHGGHPVSQDFNCEFNFKKTSSGFKLNSEPYCS